MRKHPVNCPSCLDQEPFAVCALQCGKASYCYTVEKQVTAILWKEEDEAYITSTCHEQSWLNHNQVDKTQEDVRIIQLCSPSRGAEGNRGQSSSPRVAAFSSSVEYMPMTTFPFTLQYFQVARFGSLGCKSPLMQLMQTLFLALHAIIVAHYIKEQVL